MIDTHPALIVHCPGTADVVAAVEFDHENDITAAGDCVVIRYRFSGTREGPIMDVPATRRHVETSETTASVI